MTKSIPLTHGKCAIVDDEDFEYLNQWKWFIAQGYATRKTSRFFGKQKSIRMHREIMDTPLGMETDHINGITVDNRKENLRVCTNSENQRNRGKSKRNTSGFKGVTWDRVSKKWRSAIQFDGKTIHLGGFDAPEKAAIAYDEAAMKYHKEFAKTNF